MEFPPCGPVAFPRSYCSLPLHLHTLVELHALQVCKYVPPRPLQVKIPLQLWPCVYVARSHAYLAATLAQGYVPDDNRPRYAYADRHQMLFALDMPDASQLQLSVMSHDTRWEVAELRAWPLEMTWPGLWQDTTKGMGFGQLWEVCAAAQQSRLQNVGRRTAWWTSGVATSLALDCMHMSLGWRACNISCNARATCSTVVQSMTEIQSSLRASSCDEPAAQSLYS